MTYCKIWKLLSQCEKMSPFYKGKGMACAGRWGTMCVCWVQAAFLPLPQPWGAATKEGVKVPGAWPGIPFQEAACHSLTMPFTPAQRQCSPCPFHLSHPSQRAAIISLAEDFSAVSSSLLCHVSGSDLQQCKKANERVINKCNQAESLHAVTSEPAWLLVRLGDAAKRHICN